MKKYTASYYFLFILLITGAFGSTAQHAYGLQICGLACLGFAATFLHELVKGSPDTSKAPRWLRSVDLVSMSAIALIFALKNFSVDFTISNILISILLVVLVFTFSYRLVKEIPWSDDRRSRAVIVLYYTVLMVLLASMLASQVLPSVENIIAMAGIGLSLVFLATAVFFRERGSAGDDFITPFAYVRQLGDKSAILLATGVLLGVLGIVVSARIFPPLYRGTLPDGYQRLIEEGSTNSGSVKALELKERYERFVHNAGQ